MAEPVNPFDEQAVSAYNAEKQRKEDAANYRSGGHPAPAEDAMLTPEQVGAALFQKYAERGLDSLAEFVSAITSSFRVMADAMESELENPADHDLRDPDFAVWCAAQGKEMQNAGKALYDQSRLLLWDMAGREVGEFTTPDGIRYAFKRGATSTRSVNYKTLESKYPDVYADVVTVKEKPADAPGTLSL